MPNIKLIMTDIDGTIMPQGASQVSARTVAAFHAALDAGIAVGPASGRALAQVLPFFRGDAACIQTVVATNGLEVYLGGKKIAEHLLPHEALERTRELLLSIPDTGLLFFEGAQPYLVAGDRAVLEAVYPFYAQVCKPADSLPERPILKANVFVHADRAGTERLVERLNAEIDGLDFDVPMPGFTNIMPSGWNKGSSITFLCGRLGISTDEVVVFGDAGNDLTMFDVAGHSVAVGNAAPDAAAAARWHIGRCEDDAVAAAIEALAAGEWPFTA